MAIFQKSEFVVKNSVQRSLGNDVFLGDMPGRNGPLCLPRSERNKHLYICGGTGTGKSKFLENLIRQDIRSWRNSKCGELVLDPHGSLYGDLLNWLARYPYERPKGHVPLGQGHRFAGEKGIGRLERLPNLRMRGRERLRQILRRLRPDRRPSPDFSHTGFTGSPANRLAN